jgi:hypothetical protein
MLLIYIISSKISRKLSQMLMMCPIVEEQTPKEKCRLSRNKEGKRLEISWRKSTRDTPKDLPSQA